MIRFIRRILGLDVYCEKCAFFNPEKPTCCEPYRDIKKQSQDFVYITSSVRVSPGVSFCRELNKYGNCPYYKSANYLLYWC